MERLMMYINQQKTLIEQQIEELSKQRTLASTAAIIELRRFLLILDKIIEIVSQ